MTRMQQGRMHTLGFNKRNIIRDNDTVRRGVPTMICLIMRLITNESATVRTRSNFGTISLKKNVNSTTYFTKMGEVGFTAVPKLVRCTVIN